MTQARAGMATLTADLETRYPGTNRNVTVTLLKEKVVGNIRRAVVVLFGGGWSGAADRVRERRPPAAGACVDART